MSFIMSYLDVYDDFVTCICLIRLEKKTVKRKRVFATLRVLGTVLGQLTEEIPEEVDFILFNLFNAKLQILLWTVLAS